MPPYPSKTRRETEPARARPRRAPSCSAAWLGVWLLAALLFAPAAPAAGTRPAPKPAPAASKRAAAPALSDAELEKAIRARFAKSKIAADNYIVRVQGGVATIEGKTDVIQRKGTATRLARLAGAKAVVNKIEPSAAAREKAAANLSQGRRRAQVKRSEAVRR